MMNGGSEKLNTGITLKMILFLLRSVVCVSDGTAAVSARNGIAAGNSWSTAWCWAEFLISTARQPEQSQNAERNGVVG